MNRRIVLSLSIPLVLCLHLLSMSAPPAAARPPAPLPSQQYAPNPPGGDFVAPATGPAPARTDTLWFGGDDGTGVAVLGELWDFETPGSNGFQGWTSIDVTENPDTYFGRVTAADFILHGDPCVPIQTGNTGMLWCGIHEDEADVRDFVAGMGYQNDMCQRAFSPVLTIDPLADEIDVRFAYFSDTEPGYDYVELYVWALDAGGDPVEELLLARWDGAVGDPEALVAFDPPGPEVAAGTFAPNATSAQLEVRVVTDGAWSDQDGYYPTDCGPFGADEVVITVGASVNSFDFEDGAQGWSFERCEGVGAFMALYDEEIWRNWLEWHVVCPTMDGRALGLVDAEHSPFDPPGLAPGQHEQARTGTLARGPEIPTGYNDVVAEFEAYLDLPASSGAHWRPGWRIYPYTTESNPVPHWSERHGQMVWWGTGSAHCSRMRVDLTRMIDEPLPAEWDSLQFVVEVYCDCEAFGTPPSVCTEEGNTGGSPLLDHARLGVHGTGNVPYIIPAIGGLFQDGFGQESPSFLDPFDRGNANIARDLSGDHPSQNDWLGDSSSVTGPIVTSEESRWMAQFCFRLARKGPRQDLIPEYEPWKTRFASDPEAGFVSVLMDSVELSPTQAFPWRFATYFHEDDGGYDHAAADFSEAQEILPDRLFVPGTRIEYYYRSHWYDGGAPPHEYFTTPVYELEILPMMTSVGGSPYYVEWPCVLYVDAYNQGAQEVIGTMLSEAGLTYDRYDYLDASSNFNASMKRSFGGTAYNPGGYGNNGCTQHQLLGYRLIVLNTGIFGIPALEARDFELLSEWLSDTDCGIQYWRRGLVLNGNGITQIMADEVQGLAIDFAHDVLGVRLEHESYREYNQDEAYCVYLEPTMNAAFHPDPPGISLRGNGCPPMFDFDVLGVQPGVTDVIGNLDYWSFNQTGLQEYVDYAQVVRANPVPGQRNWQSVVDGFSYHLLSERGCAGEPCANDSVCVIAGALEAFRPMLEWLEDPTRPFVDWRYPCTQGVEEDPSGEPHLEGPVDYLFAARPNPFHRRATIRFSLAETGRAQVEIFDVSGRCVRTLHEGSLDAGEHSLIWDGADGEGRPLGAGLFWVQLRTAAGYTSSRRVLVLR